MAPDTILLAYRNLFGPIYNQALVTGLRVVEEFGKILSVMTILGLYILCQML